MLYFVGWWPKEKSINKEGEKKKKKGRRKRRVPDCEVFYYQEN